MKPQILTLITYTMIYLKFFKIELPGSQTFSRVNDIGFIAKFISNPNTLCSCFKLELEQNKHKNKNLIGLVLKSETVQNITSLDELFVWCRDNEGTPDDSNEMFCPMHQIEHDRGKITALHIFLTTIKLAG
ncbi:hypothetical protein BpHYR1_030250 [Brachionus plicatilis]|uniref:Uncharacterized protein n=1 Tax=Brachionus plicatilis TaxID=10195 RepID=A0A3M7PIM1_BRAPC|nr:hypothetical protein BpHYR1_030250 [Brachionus plicatilis]